MLEAEALPQLGFVGLGAMGLPMARNLVQAGYRLTGFDLDAKHLEAAIAAGAVAARDMAELVRHSDIILTSLPSSDAFVQVADEVLLPALRAQQVVIDLGTTTPPQARRLAAACKAKEADLLDVPVSGGPGGAEKGTLYMFVGGEEAVFQRVLPILEVLGDPAKITYCGPSGTGQATKGVNQLMMGLGNAVYLEALAFGVRSGVAIETLEKALGDQGRWRRDLNQTARAIMNAKGNEQGVKFRELPYFLTAAEASEFSLPLTEALYDFCNAGERVVVDDNRPAPSFWHELITRRD